jgi:hypothetical protein
VNERYSEVILEDNESENNSTPSEIYTNSGLSNKIQTQEVTGRILGAKSESMPGLFEKKAWPKGLSSNFAKKADGGG